ncbi:MAG: YceI family protein [Terrimicrobiaceae bacterium]
MKIPHLALTSLLVATASLHAQPLNFDFKDPKGVNNIVFKLDAPLESISGTATGITGTITADPKAPEKISGKIVVDAKSLTVPNPMMQEHMHGADWLDTVKHPEITFEIKEVLNTKQNGNQGTAEVKGTFTLKGISKEVTVPVNVTYLPGRLKDRGGDKEGDLLVVRTSFQIKRGEFGIQEGVNLDKVSDVIDISLSVAGAAPKG